MVDISHSVKLAQDYMTFLVSAKSSAGHGIHSPMVYDFVRKVVQPTPSCPHLEEIEWYRDWQENSPMSIRKSTFGAGSRLAQKSIPISKLIKSTSVSSKTGSFLFRLAQWLDAKNILELGTSIGISTMYLASACPKATILTLEGDAKRAAYARDSFEFMGWDNIKLIEGEFDLTLDKVIDGYTKFDLIFFDGNHSAEPTLRYFKQCLNSRHENSVFVFDDIRWSNEMFRAWEVISQHNSVTVSIDLFNIGVAFFRNGIPKQHFMINF